MASALQDIISRSTDYRDEKQLVDYFVQLLEHHLAGRHLERVIHKQPIDVCSLGVISPWRTDGADELPIPDDAEANDHRIDRKAVPGDSTQKTSAHSPTKEKDKSEPTEQDRGSVEGSEDKD